MAAAEQQEEHATFAAESPSTPVSTNPSSLISPSQVASSPSPYTLYAENYEKLFKRLEAKPPKNKGKPMALLVMSGAFNPPHKGHIYALEAAAAYCQQELGLEVAGGVMSLEHDTVVRNKLKRWSTEVITPRHRLRLCQELVRKYAWITVDRWEVTRRAALDYLSVLEHCRRTWRSVGSNIDVKVFLLCDCSDMIKASPVALQAAGFGAITSCRLEEYDAE
jgi:nicotinamide mononucleotide adenylyltransferase